MSQCGTPFSDGEYKIVHLGKIGTNTWKILTSKSTTGDGATFTRCHHIFTSDRYITLKLLYLKLNFPYFY